MQAVQGRARCGATPQPSHGLRHSLALTRPDPPAYTLLQHMSCRREALHCLMGLHEQSWEGRKKGYTPFIEGRECALSRLFKSAQK